MTAEQILLVLGSFAAAFFGSYIHSKGSHRAIKEDLDILAAQAAATTKATEAIKAQIGTSSWVQQQRWDLKRQLYGDLLYALYKLADVYGYIVDLTMAEERYAHPEHHEYRKHVSALLEEREAEVSPLWETVLRVRGFGGLVLSNDVVDRLDKLRVAWTEGSDPEQSHIDGLEFRLVTCRDAYREIADSAKEDLAL